MNNIRIGSGAGYAGDRLEPALELIKKGRLDYICFEGLAERTIALAQKAKKENPLKGYNELLLYRMEQVLPLAIQHKVTVITNMGAANPIAAMEAISKLAKKLNLTGLKIAAVTGDDIHDHIDQYLDFPILETGKPLKTVANQIISCNTYLGCDGIVTALKEGANIIITGRVADPSLFLAPMIYEFGWEKSQIDLWGTGTLVGHLLECAGQVTGGYFADPGKKEVPNLWNLGFPFVEIDSDGKGFISKLEDAGGMVNKATCTEQLLYEIHDPQNYITPDCTANFSNVSFFPKENDIVYFEGASAKKATETYKASVGYENGFIGEGEISYGDANCLQRALLAKEIVEKRLGQLPFVIEDLRLDLLGINSLLPNETFLKDPNEIRLRVAGRTKLKKEAEQIANEVETLYTNGPSGGGGATKKVSEIIAIASILVPKKEVQITIDYTTI